MKVAERPHKPVEGAEDVVVTKLNAARALERFKGMQLEADGVGASDCLAPCLRWGWAGTARLQLASQDLPAQRTYRT